MDAIRLSALASDEEWNDLGTFLDPQGKTSVVSGLLQQLRTMKAISVLIEEEYLDRDFTDAYSAFYATVFKKHTKVCKRLHFFGEDVTSLIDNADPVGSATRLQHIGGRSYLGFIVARPVSHAPIGRAILASPVSPPGMISDVLVHADYETHVLGAILRVRGIALTQQDARIGACAQASIWMAGRHFHTRHRGAWFSTVAITQAATTLTDAYLSRSLPAGSEFLTIDNMVRALRAMGREPLVYVADKYDPSAAQRVQWTTLDPAELIGRYLDSGIPVILGLDAAPGQTIGHAVLATGHVMKQLPAASSLKTQPTQSSFYEFILVNDDQRGANLRLPINSGTAGGEIPYSIKEHVAYFIVPLPNKVFMPGEFAEKISWDMLNNYVGSWGPHKTAHGATLGSSIATGDRFIQEHHRGNVIARTYLTYGWEYKHRLLRNNVGQNFKSTLLYHQLPRFVWVTEFGTLDSLNHLNVVDRRIYAHCVIDATASRHWESRSIFHAPGMGVRYYHDEDDPFGEFKDATTAIEDDGEYYPKVRGERDYVRFGP